MTKTDDRRLDKVADSLSPREAFMLWMAEAHEHETFAAYVMSLKDQPISQHPYRRLPDQVEQAVRAAHRGGKLGDAERLSTVAVREVVFYIELHEAVVGMLAVEWRAIVFQMLLGLEQTRLLMENDNPSQEQVDKAREWVVNGAGELLMWQRVARQLSERYTDGVSLLLPHQEKRLREVVAQAETVLTLLNDHLDWLAYLQKPGKGKRTKTSDLNCDPIDVDNLKAGVEREATVKAQQMVAMAKGQAALYVHQTRLATEFFDRVWDAV